MPVSMVMTMSMIMTMMIVRPTSNMIMSISLMKNAHLN
jgi:hypothetical protein